MSNTKSELLGLELTDSEKEAISKVEEALEADMEKVEFAYWKGLSDLYYDREMELYRILQDVRRRMRVESGEAITLEEVKDRIRTLTAIGDGWRAVSVNVRQLDFDSEGFSEIDFCIKSQIGCPIVIIPNSETPFIRISKYGLFVLRPKESRIDLI